MTTAQHQAPRIVITEHTDAGMVENEELVQNSGSNVFENYQDYDDESQSDQSFLSETYEPTCYLNDISDSESEEKVSDNNKIEKNPLLVSDDDPEIDCPMKSPEQLNVI